MKYFEATFTISPYSADASDILAAIAGEVGFETFEETVTGLKGYIQQQLFNEGSLNEALKDFPFEETTITYEIKEAEDRILQREKNIDKRDEMMQTREKNLEDREKNLLKKQDEIQEIKLKMEDIKREQLEELERMLSQFLSLENKNS